MPMKRLCALSLLLLLSACSGFHVAFSLAITPDDASVPAYATVHFKVVQNIEDGSAIDVTNKASLTSSNPRLLTFAAGHSAVATASGFGGDVVVKATYQGHSTATTVHIAPAATVNAWGDNLTFGTGATAKKTDYVTQLGALLTRSDANFGIVGQKSTPIAMRQGGVATTLTIDGDLLPADGAASVTAINGQPILGTATAQDPDYRLLSTVSSNATISLAGTLGGFHGILTRTATGGGHGSTSETYTFTQDSGAPLQILAGPAPFVPDTQATLGQISVFWLGRNNYSQQAQVLADTAAAVAYLSNRKFLVLSVLNQEGEGEGTAAYTAIAQLNAQLAAAYGANYVDVRAALVAAYDPTVAQDVADHAADIPPSSLRADNLDLNAKGYGVVAATVAQVIQANNW
jgi:lysophospholipase L1-like esterase